MRLTVHTFLTLDGVMQGPGSPQEDPSDGFNQGGWAVPYTTDDAFGEIVTGWFARAAALLFGRTTFELMRGFWPQVTDPDDPVAHALNTLPKYVVSGTLSEPGWEPTTILTGDPIDAVVRLKEQPGGELQVHGCARLAASLHAAGLIDEYRLVVMPVTVGAGRRLFTSDAPPSGFRLLETRTTPSGAIYSALEPTPFIRGNITVADGREVVTVEVAETGPLVSHTVSECCLMDMPSTGEHLLTIGEFSRVSQLSIRMLRYYDEHGVLHPTHVDPASGFRYYSLALLVTARQVRQLRDVGLGVAELAACITALGDTATLRSTLLAHRGRLADDAAAVADRIREVDHLIITLEEPAVSIPVEHRTLPTRTVASLRAVIPTYGAEGLLWQRLMPAVFGSGTTPAQDSHAIAVFHDEDYKESDVDVEVQLAVAEPFADIGDVRCVEVPEQEVAVGVLNGSYDAIGIVMEAVARWVPENGFEFAGPMFNIYLVGPVQDPDPDHWVTEVCAPITKGA